MSVSYSEAGMNVPTFSRFRIPATTPAARAQQAAVQALPGCRRGRRARWRKKHTKRSAPSREKGREARRAIGYPLLQRHDWRFATYIYGAYKQKSSGWGGGDSKKQYSIDMREG